MPAPHDTRLEADDGSAQLPAAVTFLQRGWLNCNVVVIRGTSNVLIDCGYLADAESLEQALKQRTGLSFDAIDMVLITHAHPDHIGAAAAIRARSGAEIVADEETARIISCWDTRVLLSSYVDLQVERFPVTRVVRDREELDFGPVAVQAIYAPGHSPGGACFWMARERILISSDAVRLGSFGALNPLVDGPDSLHKQEVTLTALQALSPAVVLPAHGPAVVDVAGNFVSLRQRLEYFRTNPDRLAFHLMKVYLLVYLLDRGPLDEVDIRRFVVEAPWFREYGASVAPLTTGEITEQLLEDLERSGAISRAEGRIRPTLPR